VIAVFGLQLTEPTRVAVNAPRTAGAVLTFAERGPSASAVTWQALEGTGDWSLTLGRGDFIIRVDAVAPPVVITLSAESIVVSTNEARSIAAWTAISSEIDDPKDPSPPPVRGAVPAVLAAGSADWFQRHLLPLAAAARAGIKTL
jgi:hypothetical protein